MESIGKTITFYSYKGGTGRTMALVNIACLLAQRQHQISGKPVLMIDWDLEAPGLHRFFHNRLKLDLELNLPSLVRIGKPTEETTLEQQPGLIDLFYELDRSGRELGHSAANHIVNNIELSRFVVATTIPALSLMTAGRFDSEYASRVGAFQWEALYNRSPDLIRAFAEKLEEEYQYILIDSRTGLSDISGICTMLMPSMLVVIFTTNRQSLTGVEDLILRATSYRKQSSDLRPLVIFPLASRIETAEKNLRELWRFGDSDRDIIGYQPHFEQLLKKVYGLSNCDLTAYFDDALIQHIPRYTYGEEIAVLTERGGDRLSLKRSYANFSSRLIEYRKPWERADVPHDEASPASAALEYGILVQKLADLLPKLQIPLQLAGLIILVVAVLVAKSSLTSAVEATAVGILFLVFGQVFVNLNRIPESSRASFLLRSLILFIAALTATFIGGFVANGIRDRRAAHYAAAEQTIVDLAAQMNNVRVRYVSLAQRPNTAPTVNRDARQLAERLNAVDDNTLRMGIQIFKYENIAYSWAMVVGSAPDAETKLSAVAEILRATEKGKQLIVEAMRLSPDDNLNMQHTRDWIIQDNAIPRLHRLTAIALCTRWQIHKHHEDLLAVREIVNDLPYDYRFDEQPEKSAELRPCLTPQLPGDRNGSQDPGSSTVPPPLAK